MRLLKKSSCPEMDFTVDSTSLHSDLGCHIFYCVVGFDKIDIFLKFYIVSECLNFILKCQLIVIVGLSYLVKWDDLSFVIRDIPSEQNFISRLTETCILHINCFSVEIYFAEIKLCL